MRQFVVLAFLGGLIANSPAYAGERLKVVKIPCSAGICVITRNLGGYIHKFQAAAKEAEEEGADIVIAGRCESACAIFADSVRKQVCLTSQASFAFHKIFNAQELADGSLKMVEDSPRTDPIHSDDINQWVQAHGGYPTVGVLRMTYKVALAFWPPCLDEPR